MTPLGRRAFLKALSAAPALAQQMAEQTVGSTVEGSIGGAAAGFAPPPMPASGLYGVSSQQMLALAALQSQGLLPDWLKRHFARAASRYDRRLDPDVAAMQSISLGAKIRICGERRARAAENGLAEMAQEQMDNEAMRAFLGQP